MRKEAVNLKVGKKHMGGLERKRGKREVMKL